MTNPVLDLTQIPIQRAMIGGLGPWELGIILVIILIIFGAGKLPQIGSAIGEALKNFKKSSDGKGEPPSKERESEPKEEPDDRGP